MAVNNRPTDLGAVAPPPSNNEYSPSGVFDREGVTTLASQGGTSSSSIAESTINPAGTGGGGTGEAPNDATITIAPGSGLTGGGNFTTNQAINDTISLSLPPVGTMGTFGTADMPVQSVTVDQFGRVSSIALQTAAPIPVPFRDDFNAGSDAMNEAASEASRMETITLSVADGYTIDAGTVSAMTTGDVTVSPGMPEQTSPTEVTIPVTIPAVTQPGDMVGTVSVETTSIVTETDSGRTREETATPLDVMTFIPFYQRVYPDRQTALSTRGLGNASSIALENGTMVTLSYDASGPRRQYGYIALEMEVGRTYRFDAGFFDIFAEPLPGITETRFGRPYQFFEFPTQADLSFTIRW